MEIEKNRRGKRLGFLGSEKEEKIELLSHKPFCWVVLVLSLSLSLDLGLAGDGRVLLRVSLLSRFIREKKSKYEFSLLDVIEFNRFSGKFDIDSKFEV